MELGFYVIFFVASFFLACKSSNDSMLKDVLPVNPGDVEPSLGDGYDSLMQSLKSSASCVAGTTTKLEVVSSNINLEQNVSLDKLAREFSGEVNGTPRIAFIDSASGGFYRALNSSKNSVNIVYASKILVGGERLNAVRMGDVTTGLSETKMIDKCGDHFVSQINRGGMLTITINMDFGSEQRRSKWQTLFSFSGPWASVKKDLKSKIEQNKIDGMMTIKLNQIGGAPDQAFLGVKTCALNTVEDIEKCNQRVDELMQYASGSFADQVKARPVMLNYITSPLRSVGASSAPTLDQKVLQIRAELEQIIIDLNQLKSGLDTAKAKGLNIESKLEGDILYNLQLIKNVAKTCYEYESGGAGISWDRCYREYAEFASRLRVVQRLNASIKVLSVPADAASGVSIVNPYSSAMNVSYSVDDKESWSYVANKIVRFDGVNPTSGQFDSSSSGLYATKKGSMLMRKNSSYQPVERSGQVTIAPGEAIGFVMNDERGKYLDNQGAISVYWHCTNCQNDYKERPTTTLRVLASHAGGVQFRNAESGKTFNLTAYGEWRGASSWPWTDARGRQNQCGSTCPLPTGNDQLLVMSRASGAVEPIGSQQRVQITPGESVYFQFNDDRGGYRDNEGEIEVVLQCIDCP